jgi:hypothetical protein
MIKVVDKQIMHIVIKIQMVYEEEAYSAWNKAVRGEHFDKIKPL